MMLRIPVAILVLLAATASVQAGVYYSGEPVSPLPVQWRGFLLDQRSLRMMALPGLNSVDVPRRFMLIYDTYAEACLRLESQARIRMLTADESADLGALQLRLGRVSQALTLLRTAARQHPDHLKIQANLGTAWQLSGDLTQAELALQEAVRLATKEQKPFEQAHLKLVQLRRNETKAASQLAPDDLFGVTFPGVPGKEIKLPENSVAIVQQLALWLPNDGRLLWLLGEVANAHGDVRTAANLLDGCVTELGMGGETIRKHRQAYRAAVDAVDAAGDHTRYKSTIRFLSSRALAHAFDLKKLPPIQQDGATELPWAALTETSFGRKFPPKYLEFVEKLDGKMVRLRGYIRPGTSDAESVLVTEFPIGCWFCELPDPTGIVRVDLQKAITAGRSSVLIEGIFELNTTDPEAHLFRIKDATVKRNE